MGDVQRAPGNGPLPAESVVHSTIAFRFRIAVLKKPSVRRHLHSGLRLRSSLTGFGCRAAPGPPPFPLGRG